MKKYFLVRQFTWRSLLSFLLLGGILLYLLGRLLERNAIERTKKISSDIITHNILQRVKAGKLPIEFLQNPLFPEEKYQKAKEIYESVILGSEITNIKVFNSQGIITFSRERSFIGKKFKHGEEAWKKLIEGRKPITFTSEAEEEEEEKELELYVPIFYQGKLLTVFEIYVDLEPTRRYIQKTLIQIGGVLGGGFLFLYLVILGIVYKANVTILHLQEEEEKRKTLSRFFSPQVIDAILKAQKDPHFQLVRKAPVTVLFADIRNFTPLSEKMDPKEVFTLLNRLYERLIPIIFRHDGVLDKIIGDALMAEFGVPFEDPKHPQKAIECAISIQKEIQKFHKEVSLSSPIQMGIGIHTGEAFAGTLGSEGEKFEYTVIGDTVNTAARLESVAKGGQILISEAVKNAVDSEFPYPIKKIGRLRLKGKEEYIYCYEVILS